MNAVISGTGLFVPQQVISNEELVEAFNAYVAQFNDQHRTRISAGELEPLKPSSVAFIEKASGIKRRHVIDKRSILDPSRMRPHIAQRDNEQPSLQCEMAVQAAEQALSMANKGAADVDICNLF